jgi:hypothetical protein
MEATKVFTDVLAQKFTTGGKSTIAQERTRQACNQDDIHSNTAPLQLCIYDQNEKRCNLVDESI